VVEQRYRAVLEALDGSPVIEIAERYGVARQTVHRWIARYEAEGIAGLAERSHAPIAHPWRISAEIESLICELRRAHRRWGPRRLVFEMGRRGSYRKARSRPCRQLSRKMSHCGIRRAHVRLSEPVSRSRAPVGRASRRTHLPRTARHTTADDQDVGQVGNPARRRAVTRYSGWVASYVDPARLRPAAETSARSSS
jgi:transposase